MDEVTFDQAALRAAYIGRVQEKLVQQTKLAADQIEWLGGLRKALTGISLVYYNPTRNHPESVYTYLGGCLYLLDDNELWGFLPNTQIYEYAIPVKHHHLLAPLFVITALDRGTFRCESRLRKGVVELERRDQVQDWIFDFYAELGYGPKVEPPSDE